MTKKEREWKTRCSCCVISFDSGYRWDNSPPALTYESRGVGVECRGPLYLLCGLSAT